MTKKPKPYKKLIEKVLNELQAEVDLINSYSGPRDQGYVKGLQKALDALKDATEHNFSPLHLTRACEISKDISDKIAKSRKDRVEAKRKKDADGHGTSRYEEDWRYLP